MRQPRHRYRCTTCHSDRHAISVPSDRVCSKCADGTNEMVEYARNVAVSNARTAELLAEFEAQMRAHREAAQGFEPPSESISHWTEGELRTLRYLVSTGYSSKQIAERLGRSESAVANARNKYLKRRKAA